MIRIIILALVLLTLLPPAPRCRVTYSNGRAWLVCPCRTTYQCEDWYRVPLYRGRR